MLPRSLEPKHDPVERHRALVLLSRSPLGCSQTLLSANGFSLSLIAQLVRDGLAEVSTNRVEQHGPASIAGVRITEGGRAEVAFGTAYGVLEEIAPASLVAGPRLSR